MDAESEQATEETGEGYAEGDDWGSGQAWDDEAGALEGQAWGDGVADAHGWDGPLAGYAAGGQQGVAGHAAAASAAAPYAVDIQTPDDDPHEHHQTLVMPDVPDDVVAAVKAHALAAYPQEVDIYANLWLTAGTTALAGAPEPEDGDSTGDWWVALAGNLLWAATCVVPEAYVVTTAIMSFGGAAVGSGALAGHSEKPPSGKALLGQLLAEARDQMVATAGSIMDEAAQFCGDSQITDPEKQKEMLWYRLFHTPFNQAEPIRAEMDAKIRAGLAEFREQWQAWEADAENAAADDNTEDPTYHWRTKRRAREIMEEHPFVAHLSFGV